MLLCWTRTRSKRPCLSMPGFYASPILAISKAGSWPPCYFIFVMGFIASGQRSNVNHLGIPETRPAERWSNDRWELVTVNVRTTSTAYGPIGKMPAVRQLSWSSPVQKHVGDDYWHMTWLILFDMFLRANTQLCHLVMDTLWCGVKFLLCFITWNLYCRNTSWNQDCNFDVSCEWVCFVENYKQSQVHQCPL